MTERRRLGLKIPVAVAAAALFAHGVLVLAPEGDAIDSWPPTVGDFRTVPNDWPIREGNEQARIVAGLGSSLGLELGQRPRDRRTTDDFIASATRWSRMRGAAEDFPPACDAWLRNHEGELDALTALFLSDPPPRWPGGFGSDGREASATPLWGLARWGLVLQIRAQRDSALGREARAHRGAEALLRLCDGDRTQPGIERLELACMHGRQALAVLREISCVSVDDVDRLRLPGTRDFEEAWRVEAFRTWGWPRERLRLIQDDYGVPTRYYLVARAGRGGIRRDVAQRVEATGRLLTMLRKATPDDPDIESLDMPQPSGLAEALTYGGSSCGTGRDPVGITWARVTWDLPASRALTRRVAELRRMRHEGTLPAKGRISGAAAGLPSESWELAHELSPDGRLHVSLVAARPWHPEVMEWTERRAPPQKSLR